MKKSQKQALAVGAGLAAIAAAAAGVYMMTGKNAKNRKKVAKWVGDMQDDVVRELNKAGKASKATYNKVIDTAVKNYKGLKNVSAEELALAAAELKGSWDLIKSQMEVAGNSVRRVVPKSVRSVAKKVSVNNGGGRKAPAKKAAAKGATKKTASKKAAPKSKR